MEKNEELKVSETGAETGAADISAGLENFLNQVDSAEVADTKDEQSTPIPENTETEKEQMKASEDSKPEQEADEQPAAGEEKDPEVKGAEASVAEEKKEPENVVTDLMTDASTSEVTGNLPSQAEIEKAASDEAAAQVDAAIEQMVNDTVGSIDLENAAKQQNQKPAPAVAPAPAKVEESVPKKKKMKTSVKLLLALLVLAIGGLGGYYGYQANYFKTHFFPNTTINGIEASECGTDYVESEIKKAVEVYSMDISFRGKKKEHFTGEDIGYTYVATGEVEDLMNSQDIYLWFLEMNKEHTYEVTTPMTYDEEMLDDLLDSYKELDESKMEAPKDAYVDWRGRKYIIVNEVRGNKLDTELVKTTIQEAVSSGVTEIHVEEIEGAYEAPKVTKEDKDLIKHRDELNSYIDASITLETPEGKKYTLDSKTLHTWLVADSSGLLTKKDDIWKEKLAAWIRDVALEVDNVGKYQNFPATGIGIVKIRQSGYGWSIDEAAEVEKLAEEIEQHTKTTRSPVWATEPFSSYNNGFGYSYVEVDASRQHVWLYVDGECVVSTDCVTGVMIPSRYTPSGIFHVYWKRSPSILRGEQREDGTYEYETEVKYWMPFNGGIGLHDASWQPYFGGSRYLEGGGSHGCVNLPTWAAAEIYSYVYSGFPVIVYYSNGCSLE